MLKSVSKKIMSGFLAATMVVTLMPATPAQAAKAATLSGKTAAVSGTTYNYTVKNVTSSQYIKVKLSGTATGAVATVNKKAVKNGKTSAFVKGTGKDLTFKVAAKNAGKSYKLTVKVYKKDKKTVVKTLTTTAKVYSHSISKITGSTTVEVGKKVTLKAVKKYSQSKKAVTWTSSKTSVATVGKTTGVVTGKKAGTATITMKFLSGATAKVKVKVQKKKVATSKIANVTKNITLKVKKSTKLTPFVTPITSKNKVTYKTSNKKIATVSSKGVIKAKKAGTATITVKSGSKTVKVKVKVTK